MFFASYLVPNNRLKSYIAKGNEKNVMHCVNVTLQNKKIYKKYSEVSPVHLQRFNEFDTGFNF